MAKELVIHHLCDRCMQDDERTLETQEFDITINGQRAVLDLCVDHEREVTEVVELLAIGAAPEPEKRKRRNKGGRPRAAAEASDADILDMADHQEQQHPCPLCDMISASRPALGQHTRLRHGLGFTELREQGYAV